MTRLTTNDREDVSVERSHNEYEYEGHGSGTGGLDFPSPSLRSATASIDSMLRDVLSLPVDAKSETALS